MARTVIPTTSPLAVKHFNAMAKKRKFQKMAKRKRKYASEG
jgi:hypothetical protein